MPHKLTPIGNAFIDMEEIESVRIYEESMEAKIVFKSGTTLNFNGADDVMTLKELCEAPEPKTDPKHKPGK